MFESALQEFLGKDGLAEWTKPEAGMFFWYIILVSSLHPVIYDLHSVMSASASRFKLILPTADASGEGDSESLIRTKAFENGVLALPGTVFLPNGAKTAYVRASFSLLEEAEVREALRRLREVLVREREGGSK